MKAAIILLLSSVSAVRFVSIGQTNQDEKDVEQLGKVSSYVTNDWEDNQLRGFTYDKMKASLIKDVEKNGKPDCYKPIDVTPSHLQMPYSQYGQVMEAADEQGEMSETLNSLAFSEKYIGKKMALPRNGGQTILNDLDMKPQWDHTSLKTDEQYQNELAETHDHNQRIMDGNLLQMDSTLGSIDIYVKDRVGNHVIVTIEQEDTIEQVKGKITNLIGIEAAR